MKYYRVNEDTFYVMYILMETNNINGNILCSLQCQRIFVRIILGIIRKKKDFREKHYNRNTTQLHELQSIGRIEIFHQMRKS